jgi:hypothetical protein
MRSCLPTFLQVLPSPETGGRLLAAIDLTSSADDEQGKGRKGANKKEGKGESRGVEAPFSLANPAVTCACSCCCCQTGGAWLWDGK